MSHPDVHTTIRVAGSDVTPLAESDPLGVACGPEGCTSTCCKNGPPIVLNPYEISRICAEDDISYEDFLDIVESDRANGFPLILLPRDPVCHFWSGTGCSIYQARPLACRLFPLGRVFDNGRSNLVLPERNICTGLVSSSAGTVADYLRQQDTALYLEMADQWIEFVSEMEQIALPDTPVTSIAFHLLVYSPDTPPVVGSADLPSSREDLFLLRLATARQQLPRFLRMS
jgi:Fe-S-cluster containining protein